MRLWPGLFAAVDWRLAADLPGGLCCAIVASTRYVSLGSLAIAAVFSVWNIAMGYRRGLRPGRIPLYVEYCVLSLIITVMAFWRHQGQHRAPAARDGEQGGRKKERKRRDVCAAEK